MPGSGNLMLLHHQKRGMTPECEEAERLPLVSILVEPAKILFLNNAINHGVFTPLGAEQAAATGKSIFYLIETNPGPGLGILLAYMLAGKGVAQKSAYGASIIHFLSWKHMKPARGPQTMIFSD